MSEGKLCRPFKVYLGGAFSEEYSSVAAAIDCAQRIARAYRTASEVRHEGAVVWSSRGDATAALSASPATEALTI